MGCGVSLAIKRDDPASLYTEEELILKQQEEEAQRRKDAVCTYIGHLILHDEKFREMMHTMLEARDGTKMALACRERVVEFCAETIGNPHLMLFRDKLPIAEIGAFLDLEMDLPKLAEVLTRVMRANPHLLFYKEADLHPIAMKHDVEELFVRLFEHTPFEQLTLEFGRARREALKEAELAKRRALSEPEDVKRRREAEAKLKGDQVFKDHQHANLTEVQRAALALEGLAGEGAVSAEERRQLRKQFKEEKKRRKRQAQERMVAKEESEESEESEPEEPEDFDEERQGVDSFEQEMRKFIGKKNDADKMNTDLYFQRSFFRPNTSASAAGGNGALPEPQPEPERAPAGVPRRRPPRPPSTASNRGPSTPAAAESDSDTESEEAAGGDRSPPPLPPGQQVPRPDIDGRVVGLTHHGTAIWGPGRGTTRIKFAVDEQVDSRRYALRARQPEDANASTPLGSPATPVQRRASAAPEPTLPQDWFQLEFGPDGELGVHLNEGLIVRAVAPGSLAAGFGLREGTLLRAVQGEDCAGWTLAQLVEKMMEIGRPVTLTFEAGEEQKAEWAERRAAEEAAAKAAAEEAAAAKAEEEAMIAAEAERKAAKAKDSVFRDNKAEARTVEEEQARADRARKRQKAKQRKLKKQKESEGRCTLEQAMLLASEYRPKDDYSAVGRLWRAVKNQPGCPAYSAFKAWVIEQQAQEEKDAEADIEMDKAREALAEAIMALQKESGKGLTAGKRQNALVQAVMDAEKRILDLESQDKKLHDAADEGPLMEA